MIVRFCTFDDTVDTVRSGGFGSTGVQYIKSWMVVQMKMWYDKQDGSFKEFDTK